MDRRLLIAANWKMHPAPKGFDAKDSAYRSMKDVDVIVFPGFLDLRRCVDAGLVTGAQWGHAETNGAHTGDVSMEMIKEAGATHVLCGHSERRRNYGETDALIRSQVEAALAQGLQPILCVGETEEERKAGKEKSVIERQLKGMPAGIIVAYEPVWAIGTGHVAEAGDAQAMHAFIRSLVPDGNSARILYGGSMTGANAKDLLSQPDIDGGLVGGASLKPDDFANIVAAAQGVKKN